MQGGILALDLSTRTGWAVCGPDYRPATPLEAVNGAPRADVRSGVHVIASPGAPIGPFLNAFHVWLGNKIELHKPHALVFEAPILTGGKTSLDTARKLMALAALTELIAWQAEMPIVREVNVASVKKFWTGNGHARKDEMMAAARARGFAPRDDNEADALAVMEFAAEMLGRRRSAA